MPPMRTGESPEPHGQTSSSVLDIRPYRRIGAIGSAESLRLLVRDIQRSCRVDAQIIDLDHCAGDLLKGTQHDEVDNASNADAILAMIRPQTTSVLLLASPNSRLDLTRINIALASHATLRTLYLGSLAEVDAVTCDAVVCIGAGGERTLFTRPELQKIFAIEKPPLDNLENEVLFDRFAMVPQVGISVLGPVMMTGTDYPLERHPKLTELVVYLALHPEGATSRNWTTALWPDRRVPGQTVANRLSEARQIVGIASDGRPRLRRNGERHTLVEFSSDWAQFQLLAKTDSAECWREALLLVRGRPFDELAQGQWVVFEGFLAEIERSISTVALELGTSALRNGDAELAGWAAQQALKACPFDERLHRLLMRSADALGNRGGVEETLRQLALILELEGNPLHGVHPRTAKLYNELTNTI